MPSQPGRVVVALVLSLVVAVPSTAAPDSAPTAIEQDDGCPCTIWNASPAVGAEDGDSNPVELGVRFRSDTSGYIVGLRFYKYANNGGTHIANLWSNDGTLLTTATFTGETPSGWQQVMFSKLVFITANTTYVASYHTNAGHYAASGNYFSSAFDNSPLHALQDGVDGPSGVYRYGATGFPDQTYDASNYWVDPVFATAVAGDNTPPTIIGITPPDGAADIATSIVVSATFSELMSWTVPSGAFEMRDPAGNVAPANVWTGGETGTATYTLTPLTPLAYSTIYTVRVKGGAGGVKDPAGNAMVADYTWTFTTRAAPTTPPPTSCPCTIWNDASTTAAGPDGDITPVELGVRFRSDVDGFITGLRFYKHSTNSGTHVANLWSNFGTRLATATFTNESPSGWQFAMFVPSVAVTANMTYVASYHTSTGHYAANGGYFVSGFDNPPLHAQQDGVNGPSGVYRYGATSGFPTDTYFSTNYWVDVVFETKSNPNDVTPPTVASTSPAAGAPAVMTNALITATFSEWMEPTTVGPTTFELRNNATGALVPATVSYSMTTGIATLGPTGDMASGTMYTATIKGGTVDPRVRDLAGNWLTSSYSWSFTTVGTPPPPPPPPPTVVCPCSLWSASATPATADSDTNAVELGVRFQSETAGYITGLRFYKTAGNTGVHVGSLWTSTGTLLARATFAGESPVGWQEVSFTAPVAIAANTTYVASYHTNTGNYAASDNYFASSLDNPPLHAMRDGSAGGSNGVYLYGASSGFPTESYAASNYWVDVVFNTTPDAGATAQLETTGPAVHSVTPSAGATDVAVTAVVTATFTDMMAFSSVNTSTFELRDSAGTLVPAFVMAGGETPTASLTPTFALAAGTTYTATVKGGTGGVRDQTGNAMASDFSWSFTTAGAADAAGPDQSDQGEN